MGQITEDRIKEYIICKKCNDSNFNLKRHKIHNILFLNCCNCNECEVLELK